MRDSIPTESAVYDKLPEDSGGLPTLHLADGEGNILECSDDEGREEDWLKEMVVSIRTTKFEAEDR